MAKAAAAPTASEPQPKGGPSLIVQLAVLLALTGVAVGMGWFSGMMLSDKPALEAADAPEETGHGGEDGGHGEEKPGPPHGANLLDLEPITTNLAAPSETWVRMELALVFQAEPDPALAETIHQDLLAYMRTVKLHQIEGASGFQHLKADLEERAALRSEGKVTRILVRTLLFE